MGRLRDRRSRISTPHPHKDVPKVTDDPAMLCPSCSSDSFCEQALGEDEEAERQTVSRISGRDTNTHTFEVQHFTDSLFHLTTSWFKSVQFKFKRLSFAPVTS